MRTMATSPVATETDLNAHPELADLGPDFWLFDVGEPDEFAIIMRYDDAGSTLGYERATDVGLCRDADAPTRARLLALVDAALREVVSWRGKLGEGRTMALHSA